MPPWVITNKIYSDTNYRRQKIGTIFLHFKGEIEECGTECIEFESAVFYSRRVMEDLSIFDWLDYTLKSKRIKKKRDE